ncbi:MAG TPA: GIY-YIG nuclease family protein [Thermomicrobiales bacterium]|nr:GIY-YIG nuclease family protein [Thermomicrobiales bacterium]
MVGKTITMFLVSGSSNGVSTVEISGWTGKILVCPRTDLAELAARPEPTRTGIYLLIGDDLNNPGQLRVYIGQGDNVLRRLTYHNSDSGKDFWETTIVAISKDESLTAAHVRYLESRLIDIVKRSPQATLHNANFPTTPNLPEPDRAYMESFLAEMRLLLPTLGYSFVQVQPVTSTASTPAAPTALSSPASTSPIFQMTMTQSGITAKAQQINGQFVVLKGSFARKDPHTALPSSIVAFRDQLCQKGILADTTQNGCLEFLEDVTFSSPSYAAAAIAGTSTNGRLAWHVEQTGETYKAWQANQVQRAAQANPSSAIDGDEDDDDTDGTDTND